MDDESPEMEAITATMREVMREWIEAPDDEGLRARYTALQAAYQRAFLAAKQAELVPPGGTEAAHQAS